MRRTASGIGCLKHRKTGVSSVVLVALAVAVAAIPTPALAEEIDDGLAAARRAAETVNAAAFDIYKDIAKDNEGKDILFSPVNLAVEFAMLHIVAESQDIRDEIARTFRFTDTVHSDMPELMKVINNSNKDVEEISNFSRPSFQDNKAILRTLKLSNVLWLSLGNKIKNLDLLTEHYDIDLKYIDFHDGGNSVKFINNYITDKTSDGITDNIAGGNIPQIIASDDVTENIKMLSTNYVNFYYLWQYAFYFFRSRSPHSGFSSEGIHGSFPAASFSNDDYRAVEIPFIYNVYSMLIILPRKAEDFEAVEKTFDCDMFSWIKERLSFFGEPPQELVVGMPVLNVQKKYSPKTMISTNLSIICERMNYGVIHQSNFRVSQQGAVYLNSLLHASGYINTPDHLNRRKYDNAKKTSNYMTIEGFNINHPFLYLITDSRSGAILLMGRFTGE